jgi:hypothetical protein
MLQRNPKKIMYFFGSFSSYPELHGSGMGLKVGSRKNHSGRHIKCLCPEVPAYNVAAKVQKGASVSGKALAGQRFNCVMKIKQAPTQNEEYFL